MKYHKGFESLNPGFPLEGWNFFGHKRVEVYEFKFPLFNNV